MSIMKPKRVWERVGELSEDEQRMKVYRTLARLEKELDRPVTDTEIRGECNRKYGPEISFDSTQVGVTLNDLGNLDKVTSVPIKVKGKGTIGYHVNKE